MHRIGIISDTHGLLRPEVTEVLCGCDAILHGGDINSAKILEELKAIAPVYAVRGNNDKEWAAHLPETLSLELYGVRFFMVHNKKYIPKDIENVDVIIYGHSHKYEEKSSGGQLLLNPGSCGPRRFTQPITLAVLEIAKNHSFQVKRMEIAHHAKNGKAQAGRTGYEEAGESGDAGYGQENSGARDCRKERYQCRTGGADLPAVSDTSGSEPGGDSGEDGIVRINCMIIYDYVI